MTKSIEEQAEIAYPDIMGISQGSYRTAYVNGAKSRDAEIEQLKAENNKLQNYIGAKYHACLSELEHLKAENAELSDMYKEQIEKNHSLKVNSEIKLREQVKDYEVALKECEDITFLAADNGNMVHWRPAREVLKKWGEL